MPGQVDSSDKVLIAVEISEAGQDLEQKYIYRVRSCLVVLEDKSH